MQNLTQVLKERITQQGELTVATFMQAALTHPQFGYYTNNPGLGEQGDFLTAPEISQMFGELIGLWWLNLNPATPFTLTEFGPGKGTLMADILRVLLRHIPPQQLRVDLLEISPVLMNIQKETLGNFPVSINWPQETTAEPGLILGNEWLDALPIHQLIHTENGWRERMVTVKNDHLAFGISATETLACGYLSDWQKQYPIGALTEVCPPALEAISKIAPAIKNGSVALFIDYGYVEKSSYGDTLQALHQHRFSPVLVNIGEVDLTAHVNFPMLKQAAEDEGLKVYILEQGTFLQAMGIEVRTAQLAKAVPEKAEMLYRQMHRLMDAKAMGQLFKVMCITAPALPTPFPFR